MKSFKKLFALVLVVAMFASFGIGATAAFTDAADIDNTAAVQLISDLGVMTGYPDGSFKPDGNITRAEMAKIIVALKYGAASANALQGTYTVTGFTDVKPDFWAAAYIGICKNTGVINGVTPTTFNPAGNVKVVDAVKMILATLGYGKANEYVGATYTTAVLLDGLNAGILTGDENLNAFATRDQIAAFVKTAIYATLQTYDKDSGTYSPVADTAKDTIGEKTFNLSSKTGVVVGNAAYDLVDGIVNLADQSATKVWVDANGNNTFDANEVFAYNFVSDASLIGENVTVYYKNTPSLANVYPNYGYTKLTKSVSFSTTTGAALGSPIFGNGYALDEAAGDNGVTLFYLDGKTDNKANTVTAYASTNGTLLKYIDIDADNVIEFVLCETSKVESISYIASNGKITTGVGGTYINTAATASLGATVVESGLTTSDYALIQTISGVTTVKKAPVVTGKVTNVNGSGAAAVYTIAGTGYKLATGASTTIGFADDHYSADHNYYLNAQGYVVADKQVTVAASTNYAIILDSAVVAGSDVGLGKVIRLQLLFIGGDKSGTTEVVTAAKVGSIVADTSGAESTIAGYELGKIFTYSVSSTTGAYTLTDASGGTASGAAIATKANFNGSLYATNATVFVVRTGNSTVGYTYTVYTGYATLPAMTNVKMTYKANGVNVVSAAFIYDGSAAASGTKYLYITDIVPNYYYNNGTPYYTFDAIVDGAATEVKVDSDIYNAGEDGIWGPDEEDEVDDVIVFDSVGLYSVTYLNGAVKTASDATSYNVAKTAALNTAAFDATSGTLYAKYLVGSTPTVKYYTYTGSETVYLINTTTNTVAASTVEDVAALVLSTNAGNTANGNYKGSVNVLITTNVGSDTAMNTMYVLYTAPSAS